MDGCVGSSGNDKVVGVRAYTSGLESSNNRTPRLESVLGRFPRFHPTTFRVEERAELKLPPPNSIGFYLLHLFLAQAPQANITLGLYQQ